MYKRLVFLIKECGYKKTLSPHFVLCDPVADIFLIADLPADSFSFKSIDELAGCH